MGVLDQHTTLEQDGAVRRIKDRASPAWRILATADDVTRTEYGVSVDAEVIVNSDERRKDKHSANRFEECLLLHECLELNGSGTC